MRGKGDLSDFQCDLIVGARQGGISMSKTADLLGFFTQAFLKFKESCPQKRENLSARQHATVLT